MNNEYVLVLKDGGKVIGRPELNTDFWLTMGEMGYWYRVYADQVKSSYPLPEAPK